MICIDGSLLPSCAGACCTPYCDLSLGDAPCEAQLPGTACVPLFAEDPPAILEHIGVCAVPA